MKKLVMYPHSGSDNHGCEAIVRTTIDIMNEVVTSLEHSTLISSQPDQDQAVGVDQKCTIKEHIRPIKRFSADYFKGMFQKNVLGKKDALDIYAFGNSYEGADKDTLALSIGGDNYCYDTPYHIFLVNQQLRKTEATNILWGCSIEPDFMKDELLSDLKGYDLIFARETITYNALLEKGVKNARLCPDPAFLLEPQEVTLPEGFEEGNTIGINLSPMIMSYEENKGAAFENYKKLIEYLIAETNHQIALIPHVMWSHNNDRIPLQKLYEEFKDSGRVLFVAQDNKLNCMELKYIISKCEIFVAARTHSSIAAYSQCVPTLVVGYSVKAIGIARDLFGSEDGYLIPVQSLKEENDLTNLYKEFAAKKNEVRDNLVKIIPEYKSRVVKAAKEIATLN